MIACVIHPCQSLRRALAVLLLRLSDLTAKDLEAVRILQYCYETGHFPGFIQEDRNPNKLEERVDDL